MASRALVFVRVIVLAGGVLLVMPERHALPRRDRGHPLDRDNQGQQQHGKKAEESSRHRRVL